MAEKTAGIDGMKKLRHCHPMYNMDNVRNT